MKADIERAVGLALGAQAEYLLMASEAEDKQVKQVFDDMAADCDRHVKVLRSRQEYLQKWGSQLQAQMAAQANQPGGQAQGQQQNQGKGQNQNGKGQKQQLSPGQNLGAGAASSSGTGGTEVGSSG